MKNTLLFASCLVLAVSNGFSQDFDFSFTENYKVSLPARLAITTSDGNINVVPSTGSEIKVYYIATKMGKVLDITREELEEELTLEVTNTGNSLDITVRHDFSDSWLDWKNQIDVSFVIYTPKETAAILHTSDGNISLSGLVSGQECKTSDGNINISDINGRTTGTTSDGNVTAKNISGNLYARTSDGNINLDHVDGDLESTTSDGNILINNITGDIRAVTSDGNIRVTSAKGSTSAKTSDGDISFEELSGSLIAITSDGNISGNIDHLEKELIAKTSGGNIHISIPDRLGLDLDIDGESVDVQLKNFSGKSDDESVHGQINGGGITVNLDASDGNVSLVYR
jgi:hypothetical protein